MNRWKSINKVLKGAIGAIPAIPYVMTRRQRTSIAAYILGGVGVAAAFGVVALMMASPRTRHRALGAAKDTYGKVNEKMSRLRARRANDELPHSNGLSSGGEYPSSPAI